jgi:hypothetical protein
VTKPTTSGLLDASGLLERVGRLRAAHAAGRMTPSELESALVLLRVADTGTVWTIGATSGGWYAFRDSRWQPDGDGSSTGAMVSSGSVPASIIDYLENGIGTLPEPVVDIAPVPPPSLDTPGIPTPPHGVTAPAPPPLAVPSPGRRSRRRSMSSVRRAVSSISFVGGLVLTIASLTGLGPFARPSVAGPVAVGPAATATGPRVTSAALGTTASPSVTAPASATSAPASATAALATSAPVPPVIATLWFEDTFSAKAGAFWTGTGQYASASYRDGGYSVRVKPVDLPVVLSAAASDTSPGPIVSVEATFRLVSGPGDAEYGLAVTNLSGVGGLEFAVQADGRYALYRDDAESFSSVLAGARADLAGRREVTLRLEIGPGGTRAFVDGVLIGQSDTTVVPGGFGVAVRTTSRDASIVVHDYRVWQIGG